MTVVNPFKITHGERETARRTAEKKGEAYYEVCSPAALGSKKKAIKELMQSTGWGRKKAEETVERLISARIYIQDENGKWLLRIA